ncbi:MAG: hypothetical protein RL557_13 [archaeon]|jgi:hypothetical protein
MSFEIKEYTNLSRLQKRNLSIICDTLVITPTEGIIGFSQGYPAFILMCGERKVRLDTTSDLVYLVAGEDSYQIFRENATQEIPKKMRTFSNMHSLWKFYESAHPANS